MNASHQNPRDLLTAIARQAMLDGACCRISRQRRRPRPIRFTAPPQDRAARDLRAAEWVSIDNDDSRDLDQLSVAQSAAPARNTRLLVAIADVDAAVSRGSPLDDHARHNTTSVYTAARIFPMLPEKLSTDLTSLVQGQERLAMVIELVVGATAASQPPTSIAPRS